MQSNVLWWWLGTAAVLIFLAGTVGRMAQVGNRRHWLGILIDNRGRYSLTHFQLVLWMLVFLSLLGGNFFAGVFSNPETALRLNIPPEILILAGISTGSSVLATAAKAGSTDRIVRRQVDKAKRAKKQISEKSEDVSSYLTPRFYQVFMLEDGDLMDQVVDATKFQMFFLTVIAVVSYVALAVSWLGQGNTGFAPFPPELNWLIGISHAGYLGGKVSQSARTDQ